MAAQPLTGGQEIFNCYGELSNTELLLKYGFALTGNPFSTVELDKGVLLRSAQRQLGAKAFAKRQKFMLDHRSVAALGLRSCWRGVSARGESVLKGSQCSRGVLIICSTPFSWNILIIY